MVINDEAHHCYLPKTTKRSRDDARSDKHAAVWFNVMRSLRDEGHLGTITDGYGQASVAYDFSATPMWINTSTRTEPEPFEWVASDFGLMDAIESGLTKVPQSARRRRLDPAPHRVAQPVHQHRQTHNPATLHILDRNARSPPRYATRSTPNTTTTKPT